LDADGEPKREETMNEITNRVDEARQRWNEGDLPGYLTLYDEMIRLHGYAPEPMNKTVATGFYHQIWSSFGSPPPLEFHEVMSDGNLYCCRFTMTGTHRAPFMGVPATGRPIVLPGITMMRFSGSRVVERWSSADFLGLMIQIGAVPPPAS
jgi:predicted ester cyclase